MAGFLLGLKHKKFQTQTLNFDPTLTHLDLYFITHQLDLKFFFRLNLEIPAGKQSW